MAEIRVKQLFLTILLRGALGAGRGALLLFKRRAIQYKTNICCYFSKLESDVAALFFQEDLGIKEKSLKTKIFPSAQVSP